MPVSSVLRRLLFHVYGEHAAATTLPASTRRLDAAEDLVGEPADSEAADGALF